MANPHNILSTIVLISTILLQGALSIDYHVSDNVPQTPGGLRFEQQIGADYTTQQMGDANQFIYQMFDQINNPGDRRSQDDVELFISDYDGVAVTLGNFVNLSSNYIQNYDGDIKHDFTCILYHEMTHVFQWLPPGVPVGLVEGIADYTMLTSNHWPAGLAGPGQGDKWDEGYDVTARFLEYCNSLLDEFVAKLNKKMKDSYSDSYFVNLLGEPVDQLWQDYKNKYKNVTQGYVSHHRKLLY